METAKLKKFAQFARRSLLEQVSAKLKLVLAENSAARRESTEAIKKLEEAIKGQGKEQVIERVAYIWFNRFCALRLMDVNRYTRIGVVSPAEGQFQPEILAEAKMGHIDDEMVHDKVRQQIFALLGGFAPSRDPQGEAYRLLVVAACNFFHRAMPFLFQRIDDYTELLMPDDLLSGNSILAYTREAMTPDVCGVGSGKWEVRSGKWEVGSGEKTSHSPLSTSNSAAAGGVEVIGWLYQFYISEKKDEVFDGLKKNKKITPENIPAATQLFTPHWIVKYLVENSLGRLWMLNRPASRLVDRMEYYIRPDTSVGSEKWEVESKENNDGSAKLSGVDRLAEIDGLGGTGISGNQGFSQRGTLRSDESGTSCSSIDSLEHSGGTSASIDSGVQKLSIHSARVESGSGNTNHDSSAAGVSFSTTNRPDSQSVRGNQADDLFTDSKAEITSHSSLPTSHSASTHEEDFLRIEKPEDIKICDPACGSGHMLTYAFDLLYTIYEEEGVDPAEIPEKILTHNLYGIEIDERAGELAAFALTMKARAKQRRFFNKGVKPNICVLENVHFDGNELKDYMDFVGRDLFTAPLQTTLRQFEEADNFGSLIRPEVTDVDGMLRILESKNVSGQLFINITHQKVLRALRQADYLSPKYHIVIANPPYMGRKGMNGRLAAWLKDNYADAKSDLFSAFMVRNTELALPNGQLGFMSPFVWMFISSYEKLRSFLINQKTITSLVQLEYSGFDGATVPICTFTVENAHRPDFKGGYVRLSDFRGSENQGPRTLEAIKNPDCGWFYRALADDFKKIPGSPIAYWVSERVCEAFEKGLPLASIAKPKLGMRTGNNDKYIRIWSEVSYAKAGFGFASAQEAQESHLKWFPYNKGGEFRRWYGNNEYLVNWENDGFEIKEETLRNYPQLSWENLGWKISNEQDFFKPCLEWSRISSEYLGVRISTGGFLFDTNGSSAFPEPEHLKFLVAFLCTRISTNFAKIVNPSLAFQPGDLSVLPVIGLDSLSLREQIHNICTQSVSISKSDWDSYETSWDFTSLPLIQVGSGEWEVGSEEKKLFTSHFPLLTRLSEAYAKLRQHWREMTLEMQRLEEENNRIFIDAYGLQDELKPEVPLNEITLTCNPHYRYGNDKSVDELEALLLADTMRELVSYAVGCMFGRYALDKPGLILANQGETIEDYLKQVPEPSFPADDDNVIPMLDGDWFTDDIAERFRKFLRVAFGDEHYEANLQFVEKALGKNGKARDIRDYFLKDFYNDHVRRYKKRPIYWLFSSPKGSFNALIYMHRYRPDTVSVVLNDYLREFRTKLTSHKNHLEAVSISASSSQGEKNKALKEIEKITKMIAEMEEYEREVLYPLATEQVEIDLDDGVKVNYLKLGSALKKIPGLDTKEDS